MPNRQTTAAYQPAREVAVGAEQAGQRIDNFLLRCLKGVPRERIYRILRRGEVRVNRCRTRQFYRLQAGDVVRIPPLRALHGAAAGRLPGQHVLELVENALLYEDDRVLALNKPSGLAVHGGSGLRFGVIEALRTLRPEARFLELAHRIDRDTSGCLLVAKRRSVLHDIHDALRAGTVDKRYLLVVRGEWKQGTRRVDLPLRKNTLRSGERVVRVDPQGKRAVTVFTALSVSPSVSLLEARPLTGRTHQIRVHAASSGFPIVGDAKYGEHELNLGMRRRGLRRLFLHASSIEVRAAAREDRLAFSSPLDRQFLTALNELNLSSRITDPQKLQ